MKRILCFVFVVTLIATIIAGAILPAQEAKAQTLDHLLYLPLVTKSINVSCDFVPMHHATVPNKILIEVSCTDIPDGYVHVKFDTLGHDAAECDILIEDGKTGVIHDYPWPYDYFNTQFTLSGYDGQVYVYDVPVHIHWP